MRSRHSRGIYDEILSKLVAFDAQSLDKREEAMEVFV